MTAIIMIQISLLSLSKRSQFISSSFQNQQPQPQSSSQPQPQLPEKSSKKRMMNHKMASFSKPLNMDIFTTFYRRKCCRSAATVRTGVAAAVTAITAEQQQEDQDKEQNRAVVAEQISAESHTITSYHFIICRCRFFGERKKRLTSFGQCLILKRE